jgi:hypothetical protein
MGRPVVNIEVIDTWIDAQLTFRGHARGLNCRPRLGNLIVGSDANQPRAVKRSGMSNRTIGRT